MVIIDGSKGEGGGQIVRSSLALSMVTGKPFIIDQIRAGREKPGLMRQHLTAVRAAKSICRADVEGDVIGSPKLMFCPKEVVPGEYHFAVGTAGSATLVLQTVLPPLLLANAPSRLVLEGGTHNPWAPPFEFIQKAFLPLVNRMGPRVTARLDRPGFYPAGGGQFEVAIEPSEQLRGFNLMDRGEILRRQGRVLLSNLPGHIAERELEELSRLTGWSSDLLTCESVSAQGPGNIVLLELETSNVAEVFTGFGEHGVKAESVAKQAVEELRKYLTLNVPVGPHLADQLLLPLGIAVAQGTSVCDAVFRTGILTQHSLTQIEILTTFLAIEINVSEDAAGGARIVRVRKS